MLLRALPAKALGKPWTLALSFIIISISIAAATETVFVSSNTQVNLLELYTSESCSSCPPAETALGHLQNDPGLWKSFVPVAFHVDYWNSLGWRDRLSSPRFTQRQRQYATAWNTDVVYTPAFVLNGSEQRSGIPTPELLQRSGPPAGILEVRTQDVQHFTITYLPNESKSVDWQAHVAILGCGLESSVTGGENRGRHLQHDFAVLSYFVQPLTKSNNLFSANATLDPITPTDSSRHAIAVWITRADGLRPMQAVGGWLPQSRILSKP